MKYHIEDVESRYFPFKIRLGHRWIAKVRLEDQSLINFSCWSELPYLGLNRTKRKLHESLKKALVETPPCIENLPLIKKKEYSLE